MRTFCFIICFVLVTSCVLPSHGATFYVRESGADTDAGTINSPWRTIAKGVAVAGPGDTVIVDAGQYDERVTTVRGGVGETERITFKATGEVTMRGFTIEHPYITVGGFRITGHSAPSVLNGYIEVRAGGDYFHLLESTIEDGVFAIRDDFVFDAETKTISSASGGFLGAGFKAGQTLNIENATNSAAPVNTGTRLIEAITDNTITVSDGLVDDGPVRAYVSGSTVYGLVVIDGAENCVIRSNEFRNLSYDTWFVGGANNLFENNLIEACHGWDAMHFMGTNQVFRGNVIRSSPLLVYQVSPDVFENWSTSPYSNVLFESNCVYGFSGVLSSQKGAAGSMNGLTFRRNIFIDVGRFIIKNPNTAFENNTFLYVAATNSLMNSPAPHALKFEEFDVRGATIRNNIFVGCGRTRNSSLNGWYEFDAPTPDAVLSHNFVAGLPPEFEPKVGFNEGLESFNGGDPGFVDIGNPLGADGVPFTADDGLRLRNDSKLRGSGYGGVDLGAYGAEDIRPSLSVIRIGQGLVRLIWNGAAELQGTSDLSSTWTNIPSVPVNEGSSSFVDIDPSAGLKYFRLAL